MRGMICRIILGVVFVGLRTGVAVDEDVSSYSIPANAKKTGPGHNREPNQTTYNYFLPDQDISEKTQIGCETYFGSLLIERELLKNGKRHGIQKEWYTNGQEKLEAPYKNGAMNGTFKHWDEKGNLIGQYELLNSSGTVRIYDSTGSLIKEQTFKNNFKDGWAMELEPISKTLDIFCYNKGKIEGIAYVVDLNGTIIRMTWLHDGHWCGPNVEFSKAREVTKKSWHWKKKEISEDDYIKAAQTDTNLPAHLADAIKYKDYLNNDVKKLIDRYLKMPRVKIPLEFDNKGEPVLATPAK